MVTSSGWISVLIGVLAGTLVLGVAAEWDRVRGSLRLELGEKRTPTSQLYPSTGG